MNTAAQEQAHRESVLSHVPTFLFTVPVMGRWEKRQCCVYSMNYNSIQWAEFSSDSIWWLDKGH